MIDLSNRLGQVGRVEPTAGLDAAIGRLIDEAELRSRVRPRRRWLPLAVASAATVVLAVVLHLVLGGAPGQPPPELLIELPTSPGLEPFLLPEPPTRTPLGSQYIADLELVYLAGSPATAPAQPR